jgi:hypothetical protein
MELFVIFSFLFSGNVMSTIETHEYSCLRNQNDFILFSIFFVMERMKKNTQQRYYVCMRIGAKWRFHL